MRPRVRSRTAEITAAIRALHLRYDSDPVFVDPCAEALTSPWWRMVARWSWLHALIVKRLLRHLRPVHGWILVRDRLTEDSLRAFASAGGGQCVLLGAGFDSTALRRPTGLESLRMIEVDHPATQAVKLKRAANISDARAQHSGFETLALDFERERLPAALARSSFDSHAPTFFVWQGVVYYLSDRAIGEVLADLSRLAAPGSELMFDFLLLPAVMGQAQAAVQSSAGDFTARLGEHYVSFHTVEEVHSLAVQAGFDVLEILLDDALERRYLAGRADDLCVMRGFGIAHLRKPAAA